MARKKSHTTNQAQRVVSTSTLAPLLTPSLTYINYLRARTLVHHQTTEAARARYQRNAIRSVIDRRRYHPDRIKPAGPVKRLHARLVATPAFGVGFAVPKRVALCARRKVRREVLHAYKRTRKSGGSGRRRNRNFWSNVKC